MSHSDHSGQSHHPGHPQGAHKRTHQKANRRHRWQILLLVAAIVVLAVPLLVYLFNGTSHRDPLEQAVVDLHFFPLRPPTTLRGPGSLYHVDVDGDILDIVCKADQNLVSRLTQDSPTSQVTANVLQNASYSLNVGIIDEINGRLTSKKLQSVYYELSGVEVKEIPQSDLNSIADGLVQETQCQKAIENLQRARELVCQGASVLLASAEYRVRASGGTTAAGTVEESDLRIISEVLNEDRIDESATVQPKLGVQTEGAAGESTVRLVAGNSLYYGVKLAPLCLTPLEATKTWRIPRNYFEWLQYRVWQLSFF